jgi:hypothetical protein
MSQSRKVLLLGSRVKDPVHSQAHLTLDRNRMERQEKLDRNDSHLSYIDENIIELTTIISDKIYVYITCMEILNERVEFICR